MQRVNLDTASPAIQEFIRALPIEKDDLELEIGGKVLCKVSSPERMTEAEREALVEKVLGNMGRSHALNKDMSVGVIEREVREAVDEVRNRHKS